MGTTNFLRYSAGRNVFAFHCAVCGTHGEIGIPAEQAPYKLTPCPSGCGAQFVIRKARNLSGKPELEFAFGPARRKPARSEKQAKKMA